MNKKIQLFLLPFAGGNSNSFNKLVNLLDERIDSFTIEYAGRGSRIKEAFITEYNDFLDDIVKSITSVKKHDIPYALFGYSLGSALAFDIASKNLLNESPKHMFVCARGSLKEESPSQSYSSLSEDDFTNKITELGGIDQRITQNTRFRDIYFKPLRADYQIWSKYRYSNEDMNVKCDITAIYSNKDFTCINPSGWSELTNGDVHLYEMGKNHFFINEHFKDMATIINKELLSICGEL